MTAELAPLGDEQVPTGPLGSPYPLRSVGASRPRGGRWSRAAQRALDVGVAGTALVCLAPALVVIAALVRASGPGPVLYRQVRVGRNGQLITVRKFRTMCTDADDLLPALRALNMVTDGPLFKVRDDPRVTPVGRWLRRFSLDELPQLVNVLAGTMALVGPRPALPAEVATYDVTALRRLAVKPGLTGLWQVSGRSDLPWTESIRLDLRYVESWSLWLDLVILLRTVPAVLSGRGAY
jgi:lipopolysaccharide/colanic/teichoic acid biosynthesis glycosyltransferase